LDSGFRVVERPVADRNSTDAGGARDWGLQMSSVFQSGQHSACLTSKKAQKRQCAARFSGSEGITDQSDRIKMRGPLIACEDSAAVSSVWQIVGQFMTTDRIEIDPKVMMGKPVIKGTRIKVELVLRKLAEGATEDDLLDAYPRLTREDIRAAIAYAAETIAHEEIILLPTSSANAKS
jgi:uncharacterized protein (DUF433 family)